MPARLARLGYGIEKTHADGRFEIAGVSRDTIEAFSTRRAEIEAAMAERNLGNSADNPRLAERAALMTRAAKRDIDRGELRDAWRKQAADLGSMRGRWSSDAAGNSALPEREAVSGTGKRAGQGPGKWRRRRSTISANTEHRGSDRERANHREIGGLARIRARG